MRRRRPSWRPSALSTSGTGRSRRGQTPPARAVLAGVDWSVRLFRATVRLAVLLVLILVAVGACFYAYGVVVGWD